MPQLTGGEIVALFLKQQGIPYAVGIPGHGCLGLMDAFKRHDVQVIQVRHEQSAAHLADGYFRVTGKPLAVFTSIGPGAVNTAVGVATAYVDSTAMLLFTGSVHTYMFGHGVLQEIERQHWADFPRMLYPVVKASYQVTRVDQLPWVLVNAYRTAVSGRPGPVHIDLPMDIQAEAADVTMPPSRIERPSGPRPDPEAIESAAKLLAKAKRPVILAGGGVILAEASSELVKLAEHLQAPVVTTLQGKGAIPEDHNLAAFYTGSKGSPVGIQATTRADVLLAVGCRFADETASSYKPGAAFTIPPTRLVQIDIDPQELGKNYPVDVAIHADAKAALKDLLRAVKKLLPEPPKRTGYLKELQQAKEAWMKELAPLREGTPITISRVVQELREALPREAIVVTSAGHAQAALFQEFPVYHPRTHISPGGFSTMGFALPAAIGAKLAHPDSPVVAVEGDGSFLMTCQELACAVQYDIPIVVVVLNNQGWLSIRDLQIDAYGPDRVYATQFVNRDGRPTSPDFVLLAEAFGCIGERVTTPGQLGPAVARSLSALRPTIIEVAVESTHPRSQGKSYGYWDVPKPSYLKE